MKKHGKQHASDDQLLGIELERREHTQGNILAQDPHQQRHYRFRRHSPQPGNHQCCKARQILKQFKLIEDIDEQYRCGNFRQSFPEKTRDTHPHFGDKRLSGRNLIGRDLYKQLGLKTPGGKVQSHADQQIDMEQSPTCQAQRPGELVFNLRHGGWSGCP